MCEVGAGTGGLTRDAFPTLDVDNHCELLQYTATDISNVWAPKLLESIGSSKMQFKARLSRVTDHSDGQRAVACVKGFDRQCFISHHCFPASTGSGSLVVWQ